MSLFEFEQIHNAYIRCRKNKRNTTNALNFEVNLLENLYDLEHELNSSRYKPSRSVCFLTSSPKLREVFAADFRDRVVHHIVVPILEQLYEPKFIYDSYSNRKGKGIHLASARARHFMRGSRYFMQLDIRNFFYSIEKDILFEKLRAEIMTHYSSKVKGTAIEMHEVLRLVRVILYQDITADVIIKGERKGWQNIPPHKTLFKLPKNRGLPIGNLSSQFFANVYMNDFDNFVKRVLKSKRYLRYVDDFVLFANSKEELVYQYKQMVIYLQNNLGLSLRAEFVAKDEEDIYNRIIKPNTQGLDFLGYVIHPYHTLVRKRVIKNYKYKKARYLDKYEKSRGKMNLEEIKQFLSVQASFVGHIKHADSFNLLNKVGKIDEKNPFDFDRA